MSNPIQNSNPEVVDAIVDEVISRLTLKLKPGYENNESVLAETKTANPPSSSNRSVIAKKEINISAKVVTLESLRGRLNENCTVVVSPTAIVTPAVKDELNNRNIELMFGSPTLVPVRNPEADLVIARLENHFVATDWLKSMGNTRVICGRDFSEIARNLCGEDVTFQKAICFAAQPFVAVATLNRFQPLRAAFARSKNDVAEIMSTLDANLMVLDVTQNRPEQKKLIEFFTEGIQ